MDLRRNRYVLWAIAAFAFALLASVMFVGAPLKMNDAAEVEIVGVGSPYGGGLIRIMGAEVDGTVWPASEIFQGGSLEPDGSRIQNAYDLQQEPITGLIPAGRSQEVIFETGLYRGDIHMTVNGDTQYDFSSYAGYWGRLRFPVHSCNRSPFVWIGIFAVSFLGCMFFYSVIDFCYFREKKIILSALFILRCICSIFLTISLASNSQSQRMIWLSAVLSLPLYVSWWSSIKTTAYDPKLETISALATGSVMISLMRGTYSSLLSVILPAFTHAGLMTCGIYILLLPALYSIIRQGVFTVYRQVFWFYKTMDSFEKRFLTCAGSLYLFILYFLYSNTSAFSEAFYINSSGDVAQRASDIIYGYDHCWLLYTYSEFASNAYDLRHPLLKIITIVPSALAKIAASIVRPLFPQSYGFMMAVMTMLLMLLTALLLKRISKLNWIAPIYASTFFFILLSLGAEQYQASLFLICFTIYLFTQDKYEDAFQYAVWMSGATLTSGHLVPMLIPYTGVRPYAKKLIQYCSVFIGISCASGVFPQTLTTLKDFAGFTGDVSVIQRIQVFTHFVMWCFCSPPAGAQSIENDAGVFTSHIPETFNGIGILIFIICIASFVWNRKNKVCRICAWNICFSMFLCIIISWAIYEAWLYVILFSWSFLILVLTLIDAVLKNPKGKTIAYSIIWGVLIVVNGYKIKELFEFAVARYSILG